MIHLRAAHLRPLSTCVLLALAACDPCAENPEACFPDLPDGDGDGDGDGNGDENGDAGQDDGMEPEQPGDPYEDCIAQFDECLAIGVDPEACSELLDACIGVEPGEPEPPYPDPMDPHQACWDQYDACLCHPEVDPQVCEAELDACLNGCGGGEPPPPEDPCLLEYEWCLQETGDPIACEEILQWCQPPEPPPEDPCALEFEWCLEATGDPGFCEEMLAACYGNG
jgi:hypothetical protein